jgi:hypothetical protein
MNYYAQGGYAHGLKSLTDQKIQTKDGVPSFGIGGSFQRHFMKPVTNAVVGGVKAVQNIPGIKQVSDVSTQAFKPIDQALVGLDKQVGKAIPGGWGTIAQTVAAMTPGMQPLAIGLGAANGSGVMRKGGSFNLQGAMIGGATAYATSELGEYLRAAGGNPDAAMIPVSESANAAASGSPELLNAAPYESAIPQTSFSPSLDAGYYDVAPTMSTSPNFDPGYADVNPTVANVPASAKITPEVLQQVGGPGSTSFPSVGKQLMSGNVSDAARQVVSNIGDIPSDLYQAGVNAKDAVANYDYSGALSRSGKGMSDTASGIKSVFTGNINPAATAAVKSGATMAPMMSTAGTVYGVMSLADLDAQRDFLKQQQASGNIAQAEYDAALAEINRQAAIASETVSRSPFSTNPDRDVSIGETFYGRGGAEDTLYGRSNSTLYAMGGSVDDESGMDETRGLNQGNLRNGLFGLGYAAGGQPRFLSGGGDGMSDDIPATINNNQPARLADGEFVVPADVVSHIGNGSSKAGAKQLYSMMNKVRKARTGNPKQGKQINPRKYMPA